VFSAKGEKSCYIIIQKCAPLVHAYAKNTFFLPSLTFVLINMAINVKKTFVFEKYSWQKMFLFVGCFEDDTCSLISEFNFVSMCYDLLMLYILDCDFQYHFEDCSVQ